MQSRLDTQTHNIRKGTSIFSTASIERMFQLRPFVVQSQTGEKSQQQPNLKTSLTRAERYGHHFDRIQLPGSDRATQAASAQTSQVVQAMANPSKKRKRADAEAKEELGSVPGTYLLPDKPGDYEGTYAGQRKRYKTTPSERPVEADHMTPDTLHQPLGQKRNTSDGRNLSTQLPAAQIDKLLHRRKNTTGSGNQVEAQRAYLLNAHHGRVPFAGPMNTQQDYNAAAMEIDLRYTFDKRAVFGEPSLHDPRPVKSTQQGIVPFDDLAWSAARMKEMMDEAARQGRIDTQHASHLQSVSQEQLQAVKEQYPKPASRPTKHIRR